MRKINTIVYLFPFPFGKRDYDRFGVETFINSRFDVQIWDMTDYFVPDYRQCAQAIPDPVDFAGLRLLERRVDILEAVDVLRPGTLIFSFMNFDIMSFPILQALSKRGIPHAAFRINSVPAFGGEDANGSLWGRFRSLAAMTKHRLKHLNPARIRNYAFKLALSQKNSLASPALFVVDGEKAYKAVIKAGNPVEKILKTHAFDYDLWMKTKKDPPLVEKPMVVFIDEGFPNHPDFAYMKIDPQVTADVYFPLLRRFFDEIERTLELNVVIAIHPRPQYNEPEKFFGNREMIRGRTVELVRDAEFVVLSCSTAVNFAVLFKKPTLFITTDQVNRNYGKIIKTMAGYLESPLLNLNHAMEVKPDQVFNFSEAGYNRYRNEFIKMDDSPEKYFWEIVRDRIVEEGSPVSSHLNTT